MKHILTLSLFLAFSTKIIVAQPTEFTDFENFTSGSNFTQASWATAGFSVPWVNGFDVNRGIIDNTYFKSGSNSLRIFYPKDKYGTANTGAQAPLMVPGLNEYFMSYNVRFSDNFSWGSTSEGGKLPGLGGGARCSGCQVCTGSNGFTARLMWRTGGKTVIYLYHLDKVNPPCGDNYEIMVGGKNLVFQKGVWYKISQRVKVNSTTNHDGEVEMWINDQHAQIKLYNGTLVDKLSGIQFVSNGDKVDALYFSTFHGGGDASWNSTTDCYTWFDDIVISTKQSDVVSTTTVLEDFEMNNRIAEIFPQPLKVGKEASVPNTLPNSTIEWIDMKGNVVAKTQVSSEKKITTPILPSGTYILKYLQNNSFSSLKVIVDSDNR